MCGIVGYAGHKQAAPILLDGLAKLEYRGYDSAGICVYNDHKLPVFKAKGRLSNLSQMVHGGAAKRTACRPVAFPQARHQVAQVVADPPHGRDPHPGWPDAGAEEASRGRVTMRARSNTSSSK